MEEIVENQLFEHNLGVSVHAQPVRPVCMALHGIDVDQPVRPVVKAGQTGPSRNKLPSPYCAPILLNQYF